MKTLTWKLLLTLSTIAGSYCIGSILSQSDSAEQQITTPHTNLVSEEKLNPSPVPDGFIDLTEELANRARISGAECIRLLEHWKKLENALSQQFPLYDAIARTRWEDLPQVGLGLQDGSSPSDNEARVMLYIHWIETHPKSLAQFYYNNLDQWKRAQAFSIYSVIYAIAQQSLSNAYEIVQEQDKLGSDLKDEYTALLYAAQNQETSEVDPTLIAQIEQAAEQYSINITPTPKQQTVSIHDVRKALSDEQYAADPNAARRLVNQLAETDSTRALQLVQSITIADKRAELMPGVLAIYASDHPRAAMQLIEKQFNVSNRNQLHGLATAFRKALESDPNAGLDWYEKHPQPEQATPILNSMLSFGAHRDPLLVLPLILKLPTSDRKQQFLQSGVHSLANQDWDQAMNWIDSNLSEANAFDLKINLTSISFAKDKDATLSFIDGIQNKLKQRQAVQQILGQWSNHSIDDAMVWALELEDTQTRNMAIQRFSGRWIRDDIDAARQFADQLSDKNLKSQFNYGIANQLLEHSNPSDMIEYLNTVENPDQFQNIAHDAITRLATTDPQAALATLLELPPSKVDSMGMIDNLARRWLQVDPESAAKAILPINAEIARRNLPSIINAYLSFDPERVLEIPELIPDYTIRKYALESIARNHRIINDFPEIHAIIQGAMEN